ncbi:glycine--tRNA ligase subunit beta [Thermochromatium tepidum]|uniref:Glycine--tRNA ligase beta subunit n=1 Tax=Thermochromatium tepidum ATCC 43061 TaxID=316276 RepID=A0A6I6E2W0_THETI|nr:glycine--tRNA ligase subunit beta [Thermochromatium tepidum]QGU33285.1 glycine--tRNA ligase subunit beta [Thermochromatium tepidum ATCC 43061]
MSTTDLLIEIGTEELPPLALPILSHAFTEGLRDQLKTNGIGFESIEPFATPRRLALLIRGIQTRQPDQESVRRGPAVQAAFDAEGRPTPALLGFARSCGVEVEGLGREETDKGGWMVHRRLIPGRETAELVPEMTEAALAGLPIPKRMRWSDRSEEFVRPVHWVCLLLGSEPVAGTVMGLPAETRTRGHRFHHPAPIAIGRACDYAMTLREQGRVEPSFERRRERIRAQVTSLAAANGLRARIDPALLDEVTALVEWPQALLCRFDARFLEIPPEVLIETMQSHQKYFPVEDEQGRLQAHFIVVANIESRNPDQVRAGNERVIRPRFSDAAFFWSQDLKQPLASFAPRLETVVFQDRLGTQAAKCARVARLGRDLAPRLGVDPALVERAAALSKCDLMTAMVFEFPRLQGIMGRYYAERSGEDPCVSAAIEEQYRPRFAGDTLPTSPCGRALALADRLDTLVGIFGIGLRPSGTKDPYALRRAAIAVLRILIETPLDLDLRDLLERAAAGFPDGLLAGDTVEAVLSYTLERLRGYYSERVVAVDTVESVIHTGVTNPWDLDRRIAAVTQFRRLPAAEALATANKRIRNILLKADPSDLAEAGPNPALLVEVPEQRLAERIAELETRVEPLAEARDYVAILETLAELREEVDAFFDAVMVMAEDPAIRRNRLQLLRSLSALFLRVADIARLQ